MADEQKIAYGYSTNLFVSRKASSDSIVMGGTAEDSSRWTRVLSQRAAQMLWFHLTRFLFPEKSDMVTALVTTAPLRASDLPTITTHINVDQIETGGFELSGWVGEQSWLVRLNEHDARQFWTALDIALYPVGWQGSTPHKHTP
ncbi:MAG: hypothetical protein JNJ61_15090 [Anaerolineae bacterium]|nr:hypothetical protein [Anaerolineae bacterium]